MRLAIRNFALALAACSTLSCGASRPSGEAVPEMSPELPTVQGTATYRERIAMPPNAVFEAILEDVSRADAPAREVGRTTVRQPPQVPIPFTITVDPGKIDPNASYSVRGRIIVDGAQWFVTDPAYPVLTRGAGYNVQLLLKRVASSTAGATLMGGEMTYMADAARFTDCQSGQSYPIAMEADFVKTQRTYMDRVSSPGAKLYVTFEGSLADRPRMEGGGTERTVVVSSFIDAWPNQNCERSRTNASLANMYWRVTQLAGDPVAPPTGAQREPQLILRDASGKQTYSATVGCNSMSGSYSVNGQEITFASGASTLMACPPPLDKLELQLRTAINGIRRWRIVGNTLELRDDSGARLALFEATPLK
jgi:uncharacterized lipoprotein YbaY/heat shock protein HslJ